MFATRFLFPPHLSPDAPATAAAPALPAVPPATPERRRQSLVDRLLSRHGDSEAALASLSTTNIAQEDTIDTLRRENDEFRRKLPDGAVVITAAEAKSLEKLRALGTVDEVVKGHEELLALRTEKTDRETKDAAKGMAKAAGLDEEAFAAHFSDKKLKGEVRNVETMEQGKKVTKGILHIQAGEKEPWKSVTDYMATLPAHEQRALTPVAPQSSGAAPASTGVPFPVGGQHEVATGDPVGAYMTRRNAASAAKPNPILGPRPQQPQQPAPAGAAS